MGTRMLAVTTVLGLEKGQSRHVTVPAFFARCDLVLFILCTCESVGQLGLHFAINRYVTTDGRTRGFFSGPGLGLEKGQSSHVTLMIIRGSIHFRQTD